MTLLEEIKRAAAKRAGSKKAKEEYENALTQFFLKYYGGKSNEVGRRDILSLLIDEVLKKPDFALGITEGIKSYPNDKYVLACRLEDLFIHLKRYYDDFSVSENLLDNFKCKDKNERLLKILKYLHTGDKSRGDIAEAFGISERALSVDLGILQEGFEFMGSQMQIRKLGRGTNTYRSMIHPVFLALNTEEIYTMTVGLKLLSQGTVFAESMERVADKVYQQLSDYARDMVNSHVDGERVTFGHDDLIFLSTYELMKKSERPFAYFLKEPLHCTVEYQESGEMKEITGTIHLAESGFDRVIVQAENERKDIHIEDVLRIFQPDLES